MFSLPSSSLNIFYSLLLCVIRRQSLFSSNSSSSRSPLRFSFHQQKMGWKKSEIYINTYVMYGSEFILCAIGWWSEEDWQSLLKKNPELFLSFVFYTPNLVLFFFIIIIFFNVISFILHIPSILFNQMLKLLNSKMWNNITTQCAQWVVVISCVWGVSEGNHEGGGRRS